ncbi:hypothetical protein K8T06_10190, partial [bacterium]|nr:hypothetical protein [bacterium]
MVKSELQYIESTNRSVMLILACYMFIFFPLTSIAMDRVPAETLMKNPQALINRDIIIEGIISVTDGVPGLWHYDLTEGPVDAIISFSPDWEKRTDPQIVEILDQMKKGSGHTFPHPGLTVIQINSQDAYTFFEGRLELNPKFHLFPTPTPSDNPFASFSDKVGYHTNDTLYQLVVNRIVILHRLEMTVDYALSKVDLSKIGHITPKGRVQDKTYNPDLNMIDALIVSGPIAIPYLCQKLLDDTRIDGQIVDYWPDLRVGDLALMILCDLFLMKDWQTSSVTGMKWDDILERKDKNTPASTLLKTFIKTHGRAELRNRIERLLHPHQLCFEWDKEE